MDYTQARINMVESQLRPNKVTDEALLTAMLNVPRERFAPRGLAGIAYVDEDVPIGGRRVLMEPMIHARLVQALTIAPDERVLEIGTGTGYGAAVLARLGASVVSVESEPRLAADARATLKALAIGNVSVVEGPLGEGWRSEAPYRAIFISGAVPAVPSAVADQLAEGGRLVAVIAPEGGVGQAVLMTRTGGVLGSRALFDAATPELPGFAREPGFVF